MSHLPNQPVRPAASAPAGAGRIALPLLLSLLIPGLGQIYNGEKAKGLAILAGVFAIVGAQVAAIMLWGLLGGAAVGTACTVLLGLLGLGAAADAGYRASGRSPRGEGEA